MSLLVPAVVAAAGIRRMRAKLPAEPAQRGGRLLWGNWLLLPLAIALTAAWAFVLASRSGSWHGWALLVVAALAVGGLVAGRFSPSWRASLGRPALVAGLVAVLLVPAVW